MHTTANTLELDFAHANYGSVNEVHLAVLDRDILNEETLAFARSRHADVSDESPGPHVLAGDRPSFAALSSLTARQPQAQEF